MEFRLLQNVIPKHCRTYIFLSSPWKIDHILWNKGGINNRNRNNSLYSLYSI